jgi:hypothetical protein
MRLGPRIIEWIINGLTLVCLFAVASLAIQHFFLSRPSDFAQDNILKRGATIELKGIDWSRSRTNLVMALSVGCHYCEESTTFYKKLIASNDAKVFTPIALFPQPVSEAAAYLKIHGISIADVRQADFAKLGVIGTPTLIVVDYRGRIQSTWKGKVPQDQEEKVFAALGVKRSANPTTSGNQSGLEMEEVKDSVDRMTGTLLVKLQRRDAQVHVIDIRPREDFKRAHIAGAISIPFDELEERAAHEVPLNSIVILYCDYSVACDPTANAQGRLTFCSAGMTMLQMLHFPNVKILSDDLWQVRAAGIEIKGDIGGSKTGSSSAGLP